ncbi:glycosyltransferase [Flavihumibacter solisilvae]|uniref:glycosyltransferase n=1 Tax=Flavihumibacter solisilvae TaxID=1349421 RepID=UPI001364C359|nr:glycosyltransferase [Flavihumibacter solisilvae]
MNFFVVTSDRDLGENSPFENISVNEWIPGLNGEQVFYMSPYKKAFANTLQLLKSVKPDVVYFNSMFSSRFTIAPLIAIKSAGYKGRVILAPRGMLHKGALGFKSGKKKLFLSLFKTLGLHKKLEFHATDQQEYHDIMLFFPGNECSIVENIPGMNSLQASRIPKALGELRLVFVSRIHEKKNLHFLLEILGQANLPGSVLFDIYGYVDDKGYMAKCSRILAGLPGNIKVQFKGPLPNADVYNVLPNYHLFVLPTLGENFGHAIFEALNAGVPVVVSDRTPWRNLKEENAGWDLPLENGSAFKSAIEEVFVMDDTAFTVLSDGAKTKAKNFFEKMDYQHKYMKLFRPNES